MDQPYRVVESKTFSRQVRAAFGSYKRWDEISETLTLDVARFPKRVSVVPGTQLRAIRLETGHAVYFTVDDDAQCVTYEGLL